MSVSLLAYGLGNLGSVANMLRRVGAEVRLVRTADEVLQSERLLLPGVGAFDRGMTLLHEGGFVPVIKEFASTGRPLLGICLGMQLLLDHSEEGDEPGLGLIPGHSERFRPEAGLRVPHMGWNLMIPAHEDPLSAGLPDEARFYFVHSYHVVADRGEHVLGTTRYGVEFTSMIRSGNVMGAQFHPEKSHEFGKHILRNFSRL